MKSPFPNSSKMEILGGSRGPQTQSVDRLPPVAHHGTIERNTVQARWPARDHFKPAAPNLDRAVQLDLHLFGRARNLPTGSGSRSQLSAFSFCQPLTIDCLNMPYSYRRP
jgi:hypothetical protein